MQLNAAVVDRAADGRREPRAAPDDQGGDRRHRELSFNTAIARMMEFTNYFTKAASGRAR